MVPYLKACHRLTSRFNHVSAGEGSPIFTFKITPLIIVASGAAAISIFTLLISLLVIKLRKKKTHKKACEVSEENEKYPSCDDDNNPDVIPQSSGT